MVEQQEEQGVLASGPLSASPVQSMPPVTQSEMAYAGAVHLVAIFAPLWGPLIGGFLARGRSRYVEVHAWKALKEYFVLSLAYLVYGAISITFFLVRLYQMWQNDWKDFDLVQMLLRFAIGWVIFFIIGIVLLVLNVHQAWRAWKGEWPKSEVKKLNRQKSP